MADLIAILRRFSANVTSLGHGGLLSSEADEGAFRAFTKADESIMAPLGAQPTYFRNDLGIPAAR